MDRKETEILAQTIDGSLTQTEGGYVTVSPGDRLADRYVVEKQLGEGGMGIVYRAVDTQLDQPVAIKLLKKGLSQNPKAVERLKQEAQVAMMLTHPGVMRLINFEKSGDYAFLLMEYVEGRAVDELVRDKADGKLPEKTVAQLAYRLTEALDYAHAKGVIHRDIKPANIMVSPDGKQVKLMDFGIARALAAEEGDRPPIAGTLSYIAPEIFEGAPPDPRADLYALGLTMYELLAGKHPFRGGKVKEIIARHMETFPPPLEGVDRRLWNIVAQLIEKKPNARFQTAREAMTALAGFLDIDEEARVKRMKKMMEYEQGRLKTQMRQIEREKELLETRRRQAERGSGGTATAYYPLAASKAAPHSYVEEVGRPLLAGAGAGIVGVFAGSLAQGSLSLSSGASADAVAALVTVAFAIGGPAYLLFGGRLGVIGLGAGALAGWVASGIGRTLFNIFYDLDMWTAMDLAADMALAAPIGLVAGILTAAGHGWSGVRVGVAASTIAALVVAAPVGLGALGAVFGYESAAVRYLYVALVTGLAWSAPPLVAALRDRTGKE